jgi:4-hydroxy-tetrahydrodipicolinate synthase
VFTGVIPILQTPFRPDGELDFDSLARQVDFVCNAGVSALAFPGFVSEWWKLSASEIFRAAVAIRERSRGKCRVICNVTSQSTYLAVREAREFAVMGVDGLMCLPPFVVPAGSDGLLRHLRSVLEVADLPHILQYSASLTGLRLSIDEIGSLRRDYPHFCSIKLDYIPPGPMITSLRDAFPDQFTYLIGFAGLQLEEAHLRGAHGLMGGAGHLVEDLAAFHALEGGSSAAFRRLLPLLNFEMQTVETSIALHKFLLQRRGIIATDHVRQPGATLDAIAREHIASLLENV